MATFPLIKGVASSRLDDAENSILGRGLSQPFDNGHAAQTDSNQSTTAPATPAAPSNKKTLPQPLGGNVTWTDSRGHKLETEKVPDKNGDDGDRTTGFAHLPPALASSGSNTAIDPLSQHTLMRTNTDHSIANRMRDPVKADSPSRASDGLLRPSSELRSRILSPSGDGTKDKRKGPSLLSQFSSSMRISRKRGDGGAHSDAEFGNEARIDGTNACVFDRAIAEPSTGAGYIPHHKEPPRYMRTKAHYKKTREFNHMFLAQELVSTRPPTSDGVSAKKTAGTAGRITSKTGGAIWATEFSRDGKYLAAAGRDRVVRIWAVIATPEERHAHGEKEANNGGSGERLSAPVFRNRPMLECEGHTGEVLDLSWSKNNFLLSSSMDKTVRLWHTSRTECLCTFEHKDMVTKLAFHPRDDRFFLAGSLDTTLRLWSIPDKSIVFSRQLPDLVTAVAFSPDGITAIAGLLNGLCLFYETEGLKYLSQIHVRMSRGKKAKGSKITGIRTMAMPPPAVTGSRPSQGGRNTPSRTQTSVSGDLGGGEVKVLVSSNDSRIRIYNLRDKSLDIKLKGHDNACSQIAASFSDDGKYVISGSENRRTFIWSVSGADAINDAKDKRPCESFEAHNDMVTTAVFAPTQTRVLLGHSGDPVYDLCNPPPVTLCSLQEALSATDGAGDAYASADVRKAEKSPAYTARSTHYDGNIMVTTDRAGIIKVLRQDCAFSKRRRESWDASSSLSRRKSGAQGFVAGVCLDRSGSIITRNSAGSVPHSRWGATSQPLRPGPASPSPRALGPNNSARILLWRQEIENGAHRANSVASSTPAPSERSPSPSQATKFAANSASEARRRPYARSINCDPGTSYLRKSLDRSPIRQRHEKPTSSDKETANKAAADRPKEMTDKDKTGLEIPAVPPTQSVLVFRATDSELKDKVRDDKDETSGTGTGGFSLWNIAKWRPLAGLTSRVVTTPSSHSGHG